MNPARPAGADDVQLGAGSGATDLAVVNTQRARSELSSRRLLESAVELIAERGYERTTLVAIGERAGYSRGLVTDRFGSKEKLLWHLLEHHFVKWTEDSLYPDLAGLPAAAALNRAIERTRDNIRVAPTRIRAVYSILFESLVLVPEVRQRVALMHREHRASTAAMIAAGIANGDVPATVDPEAVADAWVATFRGVAYQWLLDPETFQIDRALREMSTLFTPMLTVGRADGTEAEQS
ncbi:MAG: TetR/AcrR family transcriptional regulator [Pseudonocardia sp.]